jgi:hypothetical protein
VLNSGGGVKIPDDQNPASATADKEEHPPFFGTWNRLYASIVVYTLALVLALYFMTVMLNR